MGWGYHNNNYQSVVHNSMADAGFPKGGAIPKDRDKPVIWPKFPKNCKKKLWRSATGTSRYKITKMVKMRVYYYQPQTKFGARLCFYTCLSVLLFTVATEAGGTHPTGMHTCCYRKSTKWISTPPPSQNYQTPIQKWIWLNSDLDILIFFLCSVSKWR